MNSAKAPKTNALKDRIEHLQDVTARPMFGYQCYSVSGKFFAGFEKENKLIIRLSKDQQFQALKEKELKFKPFSHGAKMGWVELDLNGAPAGYQLFEWIKKGYEHARSLSKEKESKGT